jgi:hypothetical protein
MTSNLYLWFNMFNNLNYIVSIYNLMHIDHPGKFIDK